MQDKLKIIEINKPAIKSYYNDAEVNLKVAEAINAEWKAVKRGESKALIIMMKSDDNLLHAMPVFIGEVKEDNKLAQKLILFEEGVFQNNLTRKGDIRYVRNYHIDQELQTDLYSCSIFSFNILKNCCHTPDYEKFFLEYAPLEVQESMAQNRHLDSSFKPYYTREMSLDSKICNFNMKAWFKGHYYALKLNPSHLDLLGTQECQMFKEIDSARNQAKEEALFTDSLDLPDKSLEKPLAIQLQQFVQQYGAKK